MPFDKYIGPPNVSPPIFIADPQSSSMLSLIIISLWFMLSLVSSAGIPLSGVSTCGNPRAQFGNDVPKFACTNSIDWVGDRYNNEDCRATVQRLHNVEVAKHQKQEFEFMLPGAINKTNLPLMQTPRKYTVRTSRTLMLTLLIPADVVQGHCTLAIVMLDFFPSGVLPQEDPMGPVSYTNTDVASFQDIWITADLIEICCLTMQRIPGWAPIGKKRGSEHDSKFVARLFFL